MRTAIQKYIDSTRCPVVHNAALNLVSTARVWSTHYTEGGATIRGDYDETKSEMHLWAGNFDSPDYWLPWAIAHEATHAKEVELFLPGHAQLTAYADSCLTFSMQH